MPKIKSNLEMTKAFQPLPEGDCQARIYQQPKVETPDNGPWIMQLDWELFGNQGESNSVSDSKNNNKKVNFDRLLIGGKNKDTGEAYSLNRLLLYIGELGVSYTCNLCNSLNTSKPVRKGQEYFCPSCDAVLTDIEYMSEDFFMKSARITIRREVVKTKDPDHPGQYVDAKNDDGTPQMKNTVRTIHAIS
jgi:hypothetical protein